MLGNKAALDEIRAKYPNKNHCPWLKRKADACDAMPDGVSNVVAGSACPHNVYVQRPELFAKRDGVIDSVERLFRMVNSAELGLLNTAELDPLTVTEIITAKSEIERQQNERMEDAREQAKQRSEAERGRTRDLSELNRKRRR